MMGRCLPFSPVITPIERSQPPLKTKLFLTFSISDPMEPHIHALGTFWLDLFLITSSAVLLSFCIKVWSCLWPISSSICRMCRSFFVLKNKAQSSASTTDNMTDLMIYATVNTALLCSWSLGLSDMKKRPPVLLLTFGSIRYDATP